MSAKHSGPEKHPMRSFVTRLELMQVLTDYHNFYHGKPAPEVSGVPQADPAPEVPHAVGQ